jgi:hypothetical protein
MLFLAQNTGIPWWGLLGPAIIAAIAAIVVALINVKNSKKKADELEVSKSIETYVSLYGKLVSVCQKFLAETTKASRVVIFYTENGGGVPKPGSIIHNTIYVDSYDSRSNTALPKWARQPMSKEQVQLLSKVIESDYVDVHPTETELLDHETRAVYESNRVKASRFLYLKSVEHRLFILNIQFSPLETDDNFVLPEDSLRMFELRTNVQAVIDEMERIYKKLAAV